MKAIARRTSANGFSHRLDIRNHQLTADEPMEQGGDDDGPSPQELLAASLASCTAVTVEMYAKRKGWDLGPVEVVCDYAPAERGCPTKFKVELRLPSGCSDGPDREAPDHRRQVPSPSDARGRSDVRGQRQAGRAGHDVAAPRCRGITRPAGPAPTDSRHATEQPTLSFGSSSW